MLCKVELSFDEKELGPKWMNEDNLKTLLYTDASTKRELLKVEKFEEVGKGGESSYHPSPKMYRR